MWWGVKEAAESCFLCNDSYDQRKQAKQPGGCFRLAEPLTYKYCVLEDFDLIIYCQREDAIMYRNDYKEYLEWKATGKRAPQPLSEDKRYYFIKKPDLNKIFNKKYPVPNKPTKTKRCKSIGDYFFDHLLSILFSFLEDILSAIGIFVIILLPILMIDFYILNGFLSFFALLLGYFFLLKKD